jgi:Bacterial SH3 domain
MGPSALSKSDTVIRPKSLSERLAVETPAGPEAMAERFAPGAIRPNGLSGRALIEPQRLRDLVPKPPRSSNHMLRVASMIVSLVPTAIILGLLWQGAIRLPMTESTISKSETARFVETKQASLPAVPQIETTARPEIGLTADSRIESKPGEDIPFNITIHSVEMLPARSIVAIREIPLGATFSQGRPYGSSDWSLTPNEIGDLRLHLAKGTTSGTNMRIELMGADGTILASATTRLDIAQDPRAALVLRSDESDRVDDLIKHGQKMVEVGYLAGARAYFKRAVEAGSGEAAVLLGATYDPAFIEKMGAQGIKPDLKEARGWYERAKQLGVADADAELAELADQWPDNRIPRQEAPDPAAQSGQPVVVVPADTASSGNDEWVGISIDVNVRKAPSPTADPLRIAQKGEKLRVIGRESKWVQVTDPATSETGWVYSRFTEPAPSPGQ